MDIQGNQIRIGIDVPKEVKVYREEIIERMKAEDKTPPKFLFNLNGMTAYPHPADGFSRKVSPVGCFFMSAVDCGFSLLENFNEYRFLR